MSSSILNLNYTIKLRSILMKKWLQFITSEKESKKKSRGVCGGGGGGGAVSQFISFDNLVELNFKFKHSK